MSIEQKFLNELDTKLWKAADKLRSSLDAANYKHIVLGLIFLKYVSDAFEERQEQLLELFKNDANNLYHLPRDDYDSDEEYKQAIEAELELIEYYQEANVIWVPPHARWSYLKKTAALLGYHDQEAELKASPQEPKFIFGDHTCITHLSCKDFDISQNVIPLKGKNRPTIWVYYAIQGKQTFQEYRRHWSEFIIKDVCVSSEDICKIYAKAVTKLYIKKEQVVSENNKLAETRDALLPKLLSGEIDVSAVETSEGSA